MTHPSMLMELKDDEEIFAFTHQGEKELPKDICHLLIRVTMTKATEITTEGQEGQQQKTFEEMVPTWLHDYRSVFKTEGFDKALPPQRE